MMRIAITVMMLWAFEAMATGQDANQNRSKTNVNEITDFFDNQISNKDSFQNGLEESKKSVQEGITNKEVSMIVGVSEVQIEQKVRELNSINANDLETSGHIERRKEENQYYDALEIDYSSPLVANHKKDVEKIAEASKKLMGRLVDGLKDLGIDCKQTKGNKEVEPEYLLDIQKETVKDTTYNKHICEHLRNTYNCHDTLDLKCKTRGMLWGQWQDRVMEFTGSEISQHYKWMWYSEKVESKIFICYFRRGSEVANALRGIIAQRLQVSQEQIGNVRYGYEGWRTSTGIGKEYMFPKYFVYYKYRDGNLACFDWNQEWNERCNLQ